MFTILSDLLPKDLVLLIIWEFIDPVSAELIKRNHRRIVQQIKKIAVHQELLEKTHIII